KILRLYPSMIATMNIKRDNMLTAASDPALMATDLAEKLVELGVPFRNAHHRVGSFVKWCKDNNKALNATTLEEMKMSIPEATGEFLELFSPESSVAKREITGATGPNAVASQIAFWKKQLA
ncbi:MAG: hypothetical protein KAS17_10475, partial [Victivallaceae bacterium]|nr:hypothetical protein [Victivallaceae bacterium]